MAISSDPPRLLIIFLILTNFPKNSKHYDDDVQHPTPSQSFDLVGNRP